MFSFYSTISTGFLFVFLKGEKTARVRWKGNDVDVILSYFKSFIRTKRRNTGMFLFDVIIFLFLLCMLARLLCERRGMIDSVDGKHEGLYVEYVQGLTNKFAR